MRTSLKQIVLGNFAEDVNLGGVLGQIGLGLLGIDLPADIRDIFYDITNFEVSTEHIVQTLFDVFALLPLVGGLKYTDEGLDVLKGAVKHGDDAAEAVKGYNKKHSISKPLKKTDKPINYPGNDPGKSPGEGFEWRGKSDPIDGKGNWYNPETGEKWNADLNHVEPIGPHWDYTDANGNSYRVYPNGNIEQK